MWIVVIIVALIAWFWGFRAAQRLWRTDKVQFAVIDEKISGFFNKIISVFKKKQ